MENLFPALRKHLGLQADPEKEVKSIIKDSLESASITTKQEVKSIIDAKNKVNNTIDKNMEKEITSEDNIPKESSLCFSAGTLSTAGELLL